MTEIIVIHENKKGQRAPVSIKEECVCPRDLAHGGQIIAVKKDGNLMRCRCHKKIRLKPKE